MRRLHVRDRMHDTPFFAGSTLPAFESDGVCWLVVARCLKKDYSDK